jgi:hypothetical protein
MSVEFEEDNFNNGGGGRYRSRSIIGRPETSSLSKFFVNVGLAKDVEQGYKLLTWIFVAAIVAAVLIYYFFVMNVGHEPISASSIYGNY